MEVELLHIGAAARELGVTPEHLRALERQGRIPKPPRDANGRVYNRQYLDHLRAMGVGSRPVNLKPHPQSSYEPEPDPVLPDPPRYLFCRRFRVEISPDAHEWDQVGLADNLRDAAEGAEEFAQDFYVRIQSNFY